jgi:hypothetical protein
MVDSTQIDLINWYTSTNEYDIITLPYVDTVTCKIIAHPPKNTKSVFFK